MNWFTTCNRCQIFFDERIIFKIRILMNSRRIIYIFCRLVLETDEIIFWNCLPIFSDGKFLQKYLTTWLFTSFHGRSHHFQITNGSVCVYVMNSFGIRKIWPFRWQMNDLCFRFAFVLSAVTRFFWFHSFFDILFMMCILYISFCFNCV